MSVPVFIPAIVGVALHKGELAYCLGISPYKLKKIIQKNEKTLTRLGYEKHDKVLYPNVVSMILCKSGLQIDEERLAQCIGRNFGKV